MRFIQSAEGFHRMTINSLIQSAESFHRVPLRWLAPERRTLGASKMDEQAKRGTEFDP